MADASEVDTTTLTPTDFSATLSATLDSSRSHSSSRYHLDVTREELEKRQLLHTIQLLKLEVSQKQLVIDTVRNEQKSQIEELQEQLADTLHEKKLLFLRLQSLSHCYEQELKRAEEKIHVERVKACGEEDVQRNVETQLKNVRKKLELSLSSGLIMNEVDYKHLKCTDSSSLALEDYVRLHFHELSKTLQKQSNDLQQSVNLLTHQIESRDNELSILKEELVQKRNKVRNLETQCSSLTQELGLVKTQVLEGNYKVDNFDSVKRERDALRQEVEGLQNTLADRETKDRLTKEELDRITRELSSSQQSEALLKHDKDYLSRQASDFTQKINTMEERLEMMSGDLITAKEAKEKLYQQLIRCKEDQRKEYDHRLEGELEGLRARTALEMEQLKLQTREMYDRESKVLIEARNASITEMDRAKASERETNEKYESLLKEYHNLQAYSGRHLSELQGELQVVSFDKERSGLAHQETLKDLRHLQLEQEKLQKKVELLTQELWTVESERKMKVAGLEGQLLEAQQKLECYEKIEKELDDIVMESAQMEHSCDAERVLFSYGFGTSLPTHSKRRLQQSIHLARRVLQLEKINLSLRGQLETEEEKVCKLRKELEDCKALVKGSQQPHDYLVGRVKEQQVMLQESKDKVVKLEKKVTSLEAEHSLMKQTKNKMAMDLERLLNHREELRLMKSVLLGSNGYQLLETDKYFPASTTTRLVSSSSSHQPYPHPSPHQPCPTIFTKQSQ